MDNYSKIVLTVIAISTSVLAAQSLRKEKVLQLHQSDELQRITLCTASGNCGIGTHPNAPLIIDDQADVTHLYQVPDSFKY